MKAVSSHFEFGLNVVKDRYVHGCDGFVLRKRAELSIGVATQRSRFKNTRRKLFQHRRRGSTFLVLRDLGRNVDHVGACTSAHTILSPIPVLRFRFDSREPRIALAGTPLTGVRPVGTPGPAACRRPRVRLTIRVRLHKLRLRANSLRRGGITQCVGGPHRPTYSCR